MPPRGRELLDCAPAGPTITWQELARCASVPGPHTIHRLTLLLEGMARGDRAAGRPLRGALAVSRTQKGPDGGGIPGRGFFQVLTELGRYDGPDQGPEAAAQHARELQAALAYWARPG